MSAHPYLAGQEVPLNHRNLYTESMQDIQRCPRLKEGEEMKGVVIDTLSAKARQEVCLTCPSICELMQYPADDVCERLVPVRGGPIERDHKCPFYRACGEKIRVIVQKPQE